MQNKKYEGQKKQIHIADTNHETILISDIEKDIISTKLFNRLHHISQNSTVYLTFPSNKTKRFEHSIGTMKLCGDMFYSAICNTSPEHLEGLLTEIRNVINNKIIENEALSSYAELLGDNAFRKDKELLKKLDFSGLSNNFYNRCVPRNLTKSQASIYLLTFQAIRLCGLLHDIGHPPFSHVVEASMNKIYSELKNSSKSLNDNEKNYVSIIDPFYHGAEKSQLHEKMGARMVLHLRKALLSLKYLAARYGELSFEDKYFRILVFLLAEKIFNDDTLKCLYSIISGPIDGDRLDYVNRDLANSGLNSGKVEYIRLLSSCRFMFYNNKDYVLAFYIKTINTIEDFFFKRWFLYKNIIYHHRVSKTDKLLQLCIEDIIHEHLNNNNDKSQNTTNLLPDDISGLWESIADSASNEEYFDYLIQWDDNWLLTILKRYYFRDHYEKTTKTAYKLEELLSNKKNYYSLIKNKPDSLIFIETFENHFKDNCQDIYKLYIDEQKKYPPNYKNKHGLFMFLTINAPPSIKPFDRFIENCLQTFIDSAYKEEIEDSFLVMKELKDGLKVEPFVYNSENAFELSKFSNIKTILEMDKSNFPYFYIYIKFYEPVMRVKDIQKEFLEKFAEYTVKKIKDGIKG